MPSGELLEVPMMVECWRSGPMEVSISSLRPLIMV